MRRRERVRTFASRVTRSSSCLISPKRNAVSRYSSGTPTFFMALARASLTEGKLCTTALNWYSVPPKSRCRPSGPSSKPSLRCRSRALCCCRKWSPWAFRAPAQPGSEASAGASAARAKASASCWITDRLKMHCHLESCSMPSPPPPGPPPPPPSSSSPSLSTCCSACSAAHGAATAVAPPAASPSISLAAAEARAWSCGRRAVISLPQSARFMDL
mmetsp:Transcript_53601/g.173050  ORF Transcript_53601/g.173050 Transcript_53601/m.173050 type:complete len:216 (-) Transcript_53601:380-1027(-)